jgi:hypothetical protein
LQNLQILLIIFAVISKAAGVALVTVRILSSVIVIQNFIQLIIAIIAVAFTFLAYQRFYGVLLC